MNPFWNDFPHLQRDLKRVEGLLHGEAEKAPDPLRPELLGLARNPGKGLRAALLVASARCGEFQEKHYTLAAGVELLHLASLIHDDVVDQAPLRRGRPSLDHRLGSRQAVLYGDLLFASCFRLISLSSTESNARDLARLVELMAGTEIVHLQERGHFHPSVMRALKKIMGKTAALFSLCFYVGASESGQSTEVCRLFRRAGYAFGMAFQIEDDLLDLLEPETKLGKPGGHDLRQGIFSLPVVVSAQEDESLQMDLGRLWSHGNPSEGEIEELLVRIRRGKGLIQAQEMAQKYRERALRDLSALPGGAALEDLKRIIIYCSKRKFL